MLAEMRGAVEEASPQEAVISAAGCGDAEMRRSLEF
jgi:hypothetical protein